MEKTGKIVTILLWALLIVSAILIVSLVVNINDVNDSDPDMLNWININIVWVYILGIVGAGMAVLFGLFHSLTSKEAAKGAIISIVFLGAVAVVSFLLASPEIPKFIGVDKYIADGLTTDTIKLVDTGLIATYILIGIAILSIILGPVIRLVRN